MQTLEELENDLKEHDTRAATLRAANYVWQPLCRGAVGLPKGPKRRKPPADVMGDAGPRGEITTGKLEKEYDADEGNERAATNLGRRGS